MQKITPFLWFDTQAEEAANFYTSVFKNSKITHTARYPEGAPGPAGQVMTIGFEIEGETFTALNGGPIFKFSQAISFVINCKDQTEIDYYWDKLSAGGETQQCGWLIDKFGISWQIVWSELGTLLSGPDKSKSKDVMDAMLKMIKIDVQALKDAAGNG